MKNILEERAIHLAEYIVEKKATVRAAAKEYGISKSTVHKDVAERLRYINSELFKEVKKILETNKSERHIRGGFATKKKYEEKKLIKNKKKKRSPE